MEEKTKEIKNLKDIDTAVVEEESLSEEVSEKEPEETIEELEPIVEEPKIIEAKEDAKSNKKITITIGIISSIIVILIISLLVVLIIKKKPKETEEVVEEDPFETVMKTAIDDGTLVVEINKGLKTLSIETEKVKLLYIDIDSDSKNEVVAYAEEGDKKGLIQLEINDDISFEDVYSMDSIDAFGYAYNSLKNINVWYTLKDKNYTLISSAKKIIKEEDFLENYFILANTYHQKSIIQNGIDYSLDKDLSIKELKKASFTNEELLTDNELKEDKLKDVYDKYIKEKKEQEDKEKAEQEAKEKEEKERQKLEGRLQLGNISYHFGTYNILSKDGSIEGTLMIYSDYTCVHKGVSCTYSVETITPSDDEMIPVISLSTGHIYKPSSTEGELTDQEETVTVQYTG